MAVQLKFKCSEDSHDFLTIEEHPELLFKNLSVADRSETKILTKLNEYKLQLKQYQIELTVIDRNLKRIEENEREMSEMECINKKMNNTYI